MKVKVGFSQDPTGNATERLQIVAETTDGRLVVRHFTLLEDLYGKSFFCPASLQLRNRDEIGNMREIEVDN